MDLQLVLEQRAKVEEFTRKHRIGLLTLLFTDLVGSTKLKQELGDREAVGLIQRHHALVRETLGRFKEGEEIGTAGDSFFIVFTKPSDAVQFSLLLQGKLRILSSGKTQPLLDRIGVHIGEVMIEERPDAPKPKDLYGLQVDICARVMSLAEGDQILLSRSAFDNARQVLKGQDIEGVGSLSWLNHGPYLLKGVEESLEICEVGEAGQAALKPPPDSEKVHRYVSPDAEPVLGWRPAIGQGVPGTSWVLEEKLGEGGFGEVWLGRHKTIKDRRVFKFCFRADRVRSLRREVTLFRVMKERLGEHPHIVGVADVYLEEAPYYLTMEYVAGRDLKTWSEERGGVGAIPLETRLEIVAQVAEALQAAHDAGVLHRDLKPSNILIQSSSRGDEAHLSRSVIGHPKSEFESEPPHVGSYEVQVKLTDFGIGQVVSQEALAGMTKLGFTQTMMSPGSAAQSGTQMYMAPELVAGKPASTRSDIYSLGVVLYQLLVGDFSKPVTTDWAKKIADPLLKEDLERCFAGDPEERFDRAGKLAQNLRALRERQEELRRQMAEFAVRERAAYRRGIVRTASVAAVIVALFAGLSFYAHRERDDARRHLYIANMNLIQQDWEQNNFDRFHKLTWETRNHPNRGFEWYYWQRQAHLELVTLPGPSYFAAFSPDGRRIATGSDEGMTHVWDVASGRRVLTLKGQTRTNLTGVVESKPRHGVLVRQWHWDRVRAVAFSPDGQWIVTGGEDATAKKWEASTGREIFTLRGHTNEVSSVAFSPDGQRLLTSSLDGTARVWETSTGQELFTIKAATNNPSLDRYLQGMSAEFSPNGTQIITSCRTGTINVWESATARKLLTISANGSIDSAIFSQDSQRIVACFNNSAVGFWDSTNGRQVHKTVRVRERATSVAFGHNGQRIVTGSENGTARIWTVTGDREDLTIKPTFPITSVAFSPDGQRVATCSSSDATRLWAVTNSPEPLTLSGHSDAVMSVAVSPNGQEIVTGSADNTIKVWKVTTGQQLQTLEGHKSEFWTVVAFSPDGQRIASGSDDGIVILWEVTNGRKLVTLEGLKERVASLAFSPDGQRIATASFDGPAKVWELRSGRQLFSLGGGPGDLPVVHVAFLPDGQRIITAGGEGTIDVWASATGRKMLSFGQERESRLKQFLAGVFGQTRTPFAELEFWPIWDAACSPDGRQIVIRRAVMAEVWNTGSGRKQFSFIAWPNQEAGPLAFSPDGRRILTGSWDRTVRLWDAASGQQLLVLKGHKDSVTSATFSPDGQWIVTGSSDKTAKIWRAATPEQVAAWQKEERAAGQR